LAGEWLFDAHAKAISAGVTLDDFMDPDRPAADVAFKPKCRGIQPSINEYLTNTESGPSQAQICGPIIEASLIYQRQSEAACVALRMKASTSPTILAGTRTGTVGSP
jgi:hypothetical protein